MELILTDDNYQDILRENPYLVIDFSATWCGPCKAVAPILEELAEEYKGRVGIATCDVDDNYQLTNVYGIRNVPTILFLHNGNIMDKQIGAAPKSVFAEKIENLLKLS